MTIPPILKTEASVLSFGFGFQLELSSGSFSPTMPGPYPADSAETMLNEAQQDFGNANPL